MTGTSATAAPDRASAEAGERLKRARESKGLSVKSVAVSLHLDPWAIEALESGQFAALGPPVYVKGHLQKYAALLDLEASSLMSLYETQHESDPQLAPLSLSVKLKTGGPRRRKVIVIAAAALLLVALGALAGWFWFRG